MLLADEVYQTNVYVDDGRRFLSFRKVSEWTWQGRAGQGRVG